MYVPVQPDSINQYQYHSYAVALAPHEYIVQGFLLVIFKIFNSKCFSAHERYARYPLRKIINNAPKKLKTL